MFKPSINAGLILATCALFAAPVFAKTFKLPDAEFAVASIDVPGSWSPEEVEHGLEAETKDGEFYLSVVAVGTEKGMTAEIDETFEMLKEHKVKVDASSKKEGKGKINELETQSLTLKGSDEDGPCTITILFVTIKNKMIVMTYWFTDEDLPKFEKEVMAIQNSLKAIP